MSEKKPRGRGHNRPNRIHEFPNSGGDEAALPISTTKGRPEKRFNLHWVIGTGWIHTHGMAERGYPEVEARGVPDFLAESAADLIRHICDYMLDSNVRIQPGETMAVSPRTRFRLVKSEPCPEEKDHYTVERLRMVDLGPVCDCCWRKESELN